MKTFKSIVVIKQPLEQIWETVRDRLTELAPLVDDIESVTVIERDESQRGKVRLLNEWKSRQSIPRFLQAAMGARAIGWLDRNEWVDATRTCSWDIEPSVLTECIKCHGTTRYEPAMAGRSTRVTIEGAFDLSPGALRGLAGPLEKPVSAFVESIVSTTMIPKNFRKVLEVASGFTGGSR